MRVSNKIATPLQRFTFTFIIRQAATSTVGIWIVLVIGFFIIWFVLRLFISAVYLSCMAITFIVLLSFLIIR